MADGGGRIGLVGLHQVDPGEELVGGIDAGQVLAGDVHEAGQARAAADEHRLKALCKQLVHGLGLADDHVGFDVDPQLFQGVDLRLDDVLGQTEFRDAVHEHAARHVEGFKHAHLIAPPGQLACAGKARRAAAYHGYLMAVLLRDLDAAVAVLPVPVRHEPLQPADTHRLALDAPHAVLFALAFLGADPAAYGGQGAGLGDDLIGGLIIPFLDLLDEGGDMDLHGATLHAGHVFAVEAAGRLIQGDLLGIAQGYFVEVFIPHVRLLGGHGVFIQTHIGHVTVPPWRTGCRLLPGRGLRNPDRWRPAAWLRRNPPDGRRNPGRPRRQTWSPRLR